MIFIKSAAELEAMRLSGALLARIADKIRGKIAVGISTEEIDKIAEGLILQAGAVPAFKGYGGFPANICASINEEVVHGIPSRDRLLKDGDLLKIDVGISLNGYFSDCAFTIALGRVDAGRRRLLETTKRALEAGIAAAVVNNHLTDISWAIQSYVEAQGFSVVRDFVGHGIGRSMHEAPEVPNFGEPRQGPLLKEGMVLAIEPMVNRGTWEVRIQENGWTAVTRDKQESAHFEHTVAITSGGPEILTK
ncbi:type I methionyl aminopeptidase [bacterium]|nr:MAG: type I methionyl aminopeptidase [bacterium]